MFIKYTTQKVVKGLVVKMLKLKRSIFICLIKQLIDITDMILDCFNYIVDKNSQISVWEM